MTLLALLALTALQAAAGSKPDHAESRGVALGYRVELARTADTTVTVSIEPDEPLPGPVTLVIPRAVPMGYSLGATASVQLASHEAVVTTVSIHGHGTMGDPHGPVLLLTGTMDVIDSVRQTFATLEEAPAMLAALPIGHLNVLTELSASGRYIAPITAWLSSFDPL